MGRYHQSKGGVSEKLSSEPLTTCSSMLVDQPTDSHPEITRTCWLGSPLHQEQPIPISTLVTATSLKITKLVKLSRPVEDGNGFNPFPHTNHPLTFRSHVC